MLSGRRRAGFAAALAAAWLAAAPAQAAVDCWIDAEHPQTADQRPVTDAQVAPMRRALQALNAQLRATPSLQALPETRLRSRWQVGGQWDAPARSASFQLRDHRRSMWVGPCGLHPGADRLEPQATVVATVNAPEAFFATAAPELQDEQLRAWRELPPTGQVQGHTLYGGHMLVFTRSGGLPWVPVSTAEYVDFTLRDLQRRSDEARAALQAATAQASPAVREAMREAEAEAARRRAARGFDPDPLSTMLRRVQAWRAGLTPAQLAAPARLGLNGLHDVPDAERLPRLVKPDPAFAWDRAHPAQPQMLKLTVIGNGAFQAPMQQVLQALDLAALQALVAAPGASLATRSGR